MVTGGDGLLDNRLHARAHTRVTVQSGKPVTTRHPSCGPGAAHVATGARKGLLVGEVSQSSRLRGP
jgi:hypothetical protein